MDDESLLKLIGVTLGELQPSRERVRLVADLAWSWRDPDAALAELVHDSYATAGLRSTATVQDRLLEFALGGLRIEIFASPMSRLLTNVRVTVQPDGSDSAASEDPSGAANTGEELSISARCMNSRGMAIPIRTETNADSVVFDVALPCRISVRVGNGSTFVSTPWTQL